MKKSGALKKLILLYSLTLEKAGENRGFIESIIICYDDIIIFTAIKKLLYNCYIIR